MIAGGTLYGELLAAGEVAPLFGDEAELAGLVLFEAALALAEGEAGLLDPGEAAAIRDALVPLAGGAPGAFPAPEAISGLLARAGRGEVPGLADLASALAPSVGASGMPVPGLVARLREMVPPAASGRVHFGATSQDAVDTGLVMRLRAALEATCRETARIEARLADLAAAHRETPVLARTRWQGAAPTSLGLKVAGWLDPLLRLGERLDGMRGRVLAVQLGGSVGNRAHMGAAGPAVAEALARRLGLAPAHPWHAARDRLEELAGWLASLAAACGKIASDVLLMAQGEVGEVRLAATGGSSTLPHKKNPVDAEIAVALARHAAGLPGALHQAAIHAHERDGAAWTAEWLVLPDLAVTAHGTAAVTARTLEGLSFDTARMAANVAAGGGLAHAESAAFALAAHMPREAAQRRVKAALAEAGAPGFDLLDRLAATTDAPVDWRDVRAGGPAMRAAGPLIDDVLARRRHA